MLPDNAGPEFRQVTKREDSVTRTCQSPALVRPEISARYLPVQSVAAPTHPDDRFVTRLLLGPRRNVTDEVLREPLEIHLT
jgi:hypothetical protein